MCFTICILVIYRLGVAIPLPGINIDIIHHFFHIHTNNNGLLNFLDMFSGGALNRMSIFSMGLIPYVNASIIINLIQGAHIIPYLDKLALEGDNGRKQLNRITKYLTLLLGILQSTILILAIEKIPVAPGVSLVNDTSISWHILVTTTLVTGLMFIMWLGEQITEHGIGNGASLIILIGIMERLPKSLRNMLIFINQSNYSTLLLLAATIVTIIILVIWVETAQRQIPIHYTKKLVDQSFLNEQKSFLPIKIDQSGVMAIIFTISVLAIPLTIAQIFPNISFGRYLISQKIINFSNTTNIYYNILYICLVIFFCYFYNSISFNPKDIAQHIRKFGGFIPGIRSGEPTRLYIKNIMDSLTLVGAIFVSGIAILPNYLKIFFHCQYLFSGTSLLITIGIILEILAQFKSYFIMKHYEYFINNDGNIMKPKKKRKRIGLL
jgi:preprotein translocase subunit SecY